MGAQGGLQQVPESAYLIMVISTQHRDHQFKLCCGASSNPKGQKGLLLRITTLTLNCCSFRLYEDDRYRRNIIRTEENKKYSENIPRFSTVYISLSPLYQVVKATAECLPLRFFFQCFCLQVSCWLAWLKDVLSTV